MLEIFFGEFTDPIQIDLFRSISIANWIPHCNTIAITWSVVFGFEWHK